MPTIPDSLTISKSDLQRAFQAWASAARDGKCGRTYEETQKLPVEQVASENTDYVWHLLNTPTAMWV